MDTLTYASLFPHTDGTIDELITFTEGKQAVSPYDDPKVVRPANISNYYSRLGLDNFVSDQELIKQAYRRQAAVWHPDRPHNRSFQAKATEDFTAVYAAFKVLSDPVKRQDYDNELRRNTDRGSPADALRASRQSRSFVAVTNLKISPLQNQKLDYLDILVDRGDIAFDGFGQVYMADGYHRCNYCSDSFLSRPATLTYKNISAMVPHLNAHTLLAHGARAELVTRLNSCPSSWRTDAVIIDECINSWYTMLGINLPPTQLNAQNPLLLGS